MPLQDLTPLRSVNNSSCITWGLRLGTEMRKSRIREGILIKERRGRLGLWERKKEGEINGDEFFAWQPHHKILDRSLDDSVSSSSSSCSSSCCCICKSHCGINDCAKYYVMLLYASTAPIAAGKFASFLRKFWNT